MTGWHLTGAGNPCLSHCDWLFTADVLILCVVHFGSSADGLRSSLGKGERGVDSAVVVLLLSYVVLLHEVVRVF